MTATIVGYGTLALLFWAHALYRLASRGSRERLFGPGERLLLALVALGASALWIVLVPIYVAGLVMAGSGRGHNLSISNAARLVKRSRSRSIPA